MDDIQSYKKRGQKIRDRLRLKRLEMMQRYPGVQFSLCPPKLQQVKMDRFLGMPGVDEPHAILDLNVPAGYKEYAERVIEAGHKWEPNFVTLNTLHYETGLDYHVLFAVINLVKDQIIFKSNLLGEVVYLKFK